MRILAVMLHDKICHADRVMGPLNVTHLINIQTNFNGSNTDGSFTTAVSNSFLSPLEKSP